MAAVEVTFTGVFYDRATRTYYRSATMVGEAIITGLGVGGGPIYPPDQGGGQPGDPPGIWGGGNVPMPTPPIANVPGLPPMGPNWPPGGGKPPGIWGGGNEPFPTPPIYFPPMVPPGMQPPEPPHPGDPTQPVPPPPGGAGWPVQPIEPPAYMIVWYPGVGPVIVAPPATAAPQHS